MSTLKECFKEWLLEELGINDDAAHHVIQELEKVGTDTQKVLNVLESELGPQCSEENKNVITSHWRSSSQIWALIGEHNRERDLMEWTSANEIESVPGLFVGSAGAASNLEWLQSNGITHILTISERLKRKFPYKFTILLYITTTNLYKYFYKTNKWIEKLLEDGGRLLIHCVAGVSRSATMAAAFIIYKKEITAEAAIKIVQHFRPCANPNPGFREQLLKFQLSQGLNDF